MTTIRWKEVSPDIVLDFWFPDNGHEASLETHRDFWVWRMRGGADEAICSDFADLTEAAARGLLDRWAQTPYGRLALVIALDQFPRSLWRGTPGAYAQDIKAARLVLEAFENGHYKALKPPPGKAVLSHFHRTLRGAGPPRAHADAQALRARHPRRGAKAPYPVLPPVARTERHRHRRHRTLRTASAPQRHTRARLDCG